MSRFTIGVLGLGRMGCLHARVLADLADHFAWSGGFDPAATSDFSDARALIDASDIVVVATPTPLHATLARAAVDAGRHVFIEKPVASTGSEARRLVAAADARGVRVFVGHSERFNPVVRALGRVLRGAAIESIELTRIVPSGRVPSAGSDVLLNLGVHDLDLAEHLTGAPAAIERVTGDGVASHVELRAGGARISLRAAQGGPPTRALRVVTSRAVLEGDLLTPRLTMSPKSGAGRVTVPLEAHEPLVAQALALHAALVTGRALTIATGENGARAVELAERAIRARDGAQPLPVAAAAR